MRLCKGEHLDARRRGNKDIGVVALVTFVLKI